MWLVDNRTPFAAERSWVRDRTGAEVWLVAVKCTFDVNVDGTLTISDEQPPVLRLPEHYGKPGTSSVRFEADLVLTKVRTDVLLVGHAHAPPGHTATELDVGFRVGPVQKVLRVTGNRVWGPLGSSSYEPFRTMPLVYERAFGGVDRRSANPERDWDWRNPVGTGFAISRENVTGLSLPNIEYPGEPVKSWSDRPRPAGFGPIAAHWQSRARFAGTYDDAWLAQRQPLLPDDFDDRFFQCAPEDQQAPGFLRGGEAVVLRRLTPDGERRCELPEMALEFETQFFDGRRVVHDPPALHSVIIDTDRPSLSLVWHSALRCHGRGLKLNRTVVSAASLGVPTVRRSAVTVG